MDMYQKRAMRKQKKLNKNNEENMNKTNINWYPGHMAKTKRQIKDIISLVDVLIEVVDARIPLSSHLKDLNEYAGNKESIIVFNKYDLCDEIVSEKWVKYYENLGYNIVKVNSKEGNSYKNIISLVEKLMIKVNDKRKSKGLLSKKARCLIVGVPNVGKSTLINRLVGKNSLETGNKPGVTRNLKTLKINDKIDLIDSPGLLWPNISENNVAYNLASMSSIREEVIPVFEVAAYILDMLSKHYPKKLRDEFGIDSFHYDDIENIYSKISEYKNIKSKEIDYDRISIFILNQIKNEKIKGITFDRL